jgi:hypothetical protein
MAAEFMSRIAPDSLRCFQAETVDESTMTVIMR